MPIQDELSDSILSLYKTKGKAKAYEDIVDFLDKYYKKVSRQINELAQKVEKMEKSGRKDHAWFSALHQLQTLRQQILNIREIQLDFLQRLQDVLAEQEKCEDEFGMTRTCPLSSVCTTVAKKVLRWQ